MLISTSILNLDEKRIDEIISSDTDYIHIDVMDGEFVPNTKDFTNILSNNNITKPLDIHLMVSNPLEYIDIYSKFNPSIITFHVEVKEDIKALISLIKFKNIKVGLAIKPNTDLELIKPYFDLIDVLLIMSVEPGRGGQEFLLSTYHKIEEINSLKHKFLVEVDGGVNNTNIKSLNVDIAVSGSYITKSNDFNKTIHILKDLVKNG